MPALGVGTRAAGRSGPKVKPPKARKVYGPPAPKRQVYGPPVPKAKPRTPRKPTAAERNVASSRANVRRKTQRVEERHFTRRPENSVAAVDKFKRSRKYGEALAAAHVSKEVQDRLRSARSAPDYQPKVLGIPSYRKTKARDLIGDPRHQTPRDRTKPIDSHSILETNNKSLPELIALRDTLKGDRKHQTERLDKYVRDENLRKATVKKAGTTSGAAGLKILDYTMRGNYASAGAASAIAKGKSPAKVAKAAVRGVRGKDKKTYSTVLTEQGWKPKGKLGKTAKGVASFTADVAADPTTYVTFGAGSVAAKAATKASAKAEAHAAKVLADSAAKGRTLGKREAARVTERAQGGGASAPTLAERHARSTGERAEAAAPKGKGVTVKFAGKEVPGVRRGTAAVGRGTQKAARKALPAGVRRRAGGVRTALRKTVRPMTRPHGVGAAEWKEVRQGERRSRAHVGRTDERAQTLAREAAQHIPAKHYDAVIEAIERDRLRANLPAEIRNDKAARAAVHNIRSAYRGALREARRAGGVEGRVGNLREWLGGGEKQALGKTIASEQKGQKRALKSAQRHEREAVEKVARAEEVARGSMERHAAVATEHARGKARQQAAVQTERARGQAAVQTERARGKSKAEVQAEQHAANVAFERAHAGARVSVAAPNAALKPLMRDLDSAKTAHGTAKTSLRRAEAHLKRTLAKPGAQRRHIASAYGKVTRAQRRVEEASTTLKGARTTLRAERKRTAGVAPAEHEALLGAIENKATKRKAAPVQRVVPERTRAQRVERIEPEAPKGRRMEKAGARHGERVETLEGARGRHEAAQAIPSRSLNDSDASYLKRLHEHATTHNLPLLRERVEKLQAKQPSDLARGYYPRDFDDRVLKQLGLSPSKAEGHTYTTTGTGSKVARITPGMKRSTQRRLSSVNPAREAAGQTPFSTNIPLTSLNYLKRMGRQTATGEFAKELAGKGTPVKIARKDGKVVQPTVPEGQALYQLGYKDKQFGLHPVGSIPEKPSGQYVTLNPRLVEETQTETKQIVPSLPGEALYDKVSAGWRKTAITSASYHIRNAISDINTAYLSIKGRKLPSQTGSAMKVVKAGNKQTKQWRPTASDMTMKIAGKDMPVDEFLKLARKEGVIDSGYFGAEVASLAGESAERASRVARTGGKVGRTLKRANLSRENTMRIAVFKDALDRGLKPADAADVSNKFLIDYGDLTQFERRALRRLSGFYTWTARSIPLHAEQLVTKPGKYANVEKLRQNIGNATTGQTEQERQQGMTDTVLKGYPVVIGKRAIGLGLTQTLLNEFPTSPTPEGMKAWKQELDKFAWGNLNPIPRAVIESRTGRNVVTKAEIENEQRPLVAAPAWVQHLPDALQKMLGVTPPKGKGPGGQGFTDPKTGRASWAWNGKNDWKYDQLMLGFIGQAAAVVNSGRSQATKEQAVGSILGAKIDPLDKVMTERANVQAGRADLTALKRARGMLNQQGINAEHPTPEWKRLNDAINKAEPRAKKVKAKRGGFGQGTASGSNNFGKGTASGSSNFGKGGF